MRKNSAISTLGTTTREAHWQRWRQWMSATPHRAVGSTTPARPTCTHSAAAAIQVRTFWSARPAAASSSAAPARRGPSSESRSMAARRPSTFATWIRCNRHGCTWTTSGCATPAQLTDDRANVVQLAPLEEPTRTCSLPVRAGPLPAPAPRVAAAAVARQRQPWPRRELYSASVDALSGFGIGGRDHTPLY